MLPHATLLVPQNFNPSLKSIVQAIDFSKYSPIIQKVGREMQRRYPSGKLLLQPLHVTKSALHYFSGPNRTQINQNLIQEQESMQKRWKRWFPEAENLEIISTVESSIGSCLSKYLVENKVGMVMVGITGSSALTGLYIGQVTNELIQLQGEYAVFVLKMSAI